MNNVHPTTRNTPVRSPYSTLFSTDTSFSSIRLSCHVISLPTCTRSTAMNVYCNERWYPRFIKYCSSGNRWSSRLKGELITEETTLIAFQVIYAYISIIFVIILYVLYFPLSITIISSWSYNSLGVSYLQVVYFYNDVLN